MTSGSYIGLRTVNTRTRFDDVQANEMELSYLHSDHLGSNSLMTDATGAVVPNSQAAYLPFGDWRNEPSTSDLTDVGYTGHRHNNTASNDLGLIYMNARYYLPGTGRFASADTIVPDPNNAQSYNRFSYVYNNPLKFIDPSGHCGINSDNYTSASVDELQECYDINIDLVEGEVYLTDLAEALWLFADWLGGVDAFRQLVAGANGLQNIVYMTAGKYTEGYADDGGGVGYMPGETLGEYIAAVGTIFIYGEALTAGTNMVSFFIHELVHPMQNKNPELMGIFARATGPVISAEKVGLIGEEGWSPDAWQYTGSFRCQAQPVVPVNVCGDNVNSQVYRWLGDPDNLLPYASFNSPSRRRGHEQMAQAISLAISQPSHSQWAQANNWASSVWYAVQVKQGVQWR